MSETDNPHAGSHPFDSDIAAPGSGHVLGGRIDGIYLPSQSNATTPLQLPLPGIVIFVHGVNSDGEWFKQAERGLCEGLNDRLKRRNEHLAYPTPEGGQLTPATYMPELTADGYINPKMKSNTFLSRSGSFSPVIQFRWGYKASSEELQKYGEGIYLNEKRYWGGGPFANGCTSLPDLWGQGLSEDLFLWLSIQHLNPTNDRHVYSCPPRPYYVLAALRLATLVKAIRLQQADTPITIVCHSQGNMIGLAAAFLGDAMPDVSDSTGAKGRCVADSYVLCNAPYSLVQANFTENYTQGHMSDKNGRTGRQTGPARIKTFANFLKIVNGQVKAQMSAERIDKFMANAAHGFTAQLDMTKFGLKGSTYGRVTVYCNPHDQVISATTVQGIGWRGLSAQEIAAVGGEGIYTQRVFAQGFSVGKAGKYHYWTDHYKKVKHGSQDFWYPQSLVAKYSVAKALDASRSLFGKVISVASSPLMIVAMRLAGSRINALPAENWEVPLAAPDLPAPFKPESARFGQSSTDFDEGYDAPGESRDKGRARDGDDPYAHDTTIPKSSDGTIRRTSDAARGDQDSEAALRYEDHARIRMQARREGMAKKDADVAPEDDLQSAGPAYTKWRNKKISTSLADNIDSHATDHSTIMTNGMHAQKALAYDVAIGNCHLLADELHKLRVAADWRFLDELDSADANRSFNEYFQTGRFKKKTVSEWAGDNDGQGRMPTSIIDERESIARPEPTRGDDL